MDELGWDTSHPAWHMAGRDEMVEFYADQPRQPAGAIAHASKCAVCGKPIAAMEVCDNCAAKHLADVDLEGPGGWMVQDYLRE